MTTPTDTSSTPPVPPAAAADSNDPMLAMLCHLSIFFGMGFVLPLIIFLVKKDSPFVQANAASALDFHVTVILAVIVSIVLMFVIIGFLLLPIIGIATLVLAIIATMKASKGEIYHYPFSLRLFRR
jgi:uncharacterized Tic20 family protein